MSNKYVSVAGECKDSWIMKIEIFILPSLESKFKWFKFYFILFFYEFTKFYAVVPIQKFWLIKNPIPSILNKIILILAINFYDTFKSKYNFLLFVRVRNYEIIECILTLLPKVANKKLY